VSKREDNDYTEANGSDGSPMLSSKKW